MAIYVKTSSDIFERIRRLNFPAGEYAVFGSALLDVWGLRHAQDLDIIVMPRLYQQLKNEGWQEQQGHGYTMLNRDDVNVTTAKDQPVEGKYDPDRLELIHDAVLIDGLPFVPIEEVIACKRDFNRHKDLQDLVLIERYLKQHR